MSRLSLQRHSAPLGASHLALIEAHRPRIVSFHFGLPAPDLLAAVKAAGAVVMCSATCVAEARLLAGQGADVIVAQGAEAGGHRGTFTGLAVTQQTGTMALVPQIVDAVDRPVVAAGGITTGRGIAAALMLGAVGGTDGDGIPLLSGSPGEYRPPQGSSRSAR